MSQPRIGVIGGSGLYEMEELTDREEVRVATPFGDPSDAFIIGTLEGRRVCFLSRHGRGHRYSPSEVPYRANIWGMKSLGVEAIYSASAVGSLREDIEPLHVVVPSQFFDRTRGRIATFFRDGVVAHVAFADPLCEELRDVLVDAAGGAGCMYHDGGTYVCMEGPQFSTKAESELYRSWGLDIIGMTNLTEAKLAREAGICYATLAMVTDYDCWHPDHDHVTAEMIIANLMQNVRDAQNIIKAAVAAYPEQRACGCRDALRNAVLTHPDAIPAEARERLALFLDPILGGTQ
ncbi:MAG: S-methyl-5'-thioadenosine phosphorylase [Acidobacteriota bacterium]|jgi:5'-methylthioadenosine phosphorylase